MQNYSIPQYLMSSIADAVSSLETHASLDSLFLYANAPGDPPEGSKAVKALDWLRRISKECGADAAAQRSMVKSAEKPVCSPG